MAFYKTDFQAHWLTYDGQIEIPMYQRSDYGHFKSLFEAFNHNLEYRMKKERTNAEAIRALTVINYDLYRDHKIPNCSFNNSVKPINPYDPFNREFKIHFVLHKGGQGSLKILAPNILQALAGFIQKYDVSLDPNVYPDEFDYFQIWEENWRDILST